MNLKKLPVIACMMAFLLAATNCLAQNYDLIVSSDGDSIICQIDSITDSHLYFEMKSANHWTHTRIEIARVTRYERDVIRLKDYLFKPGTTIIESVYSKSLPRNSAYVGIMSVSYSRTIEGNPLSITLGAGLSYIENPGMLLEITGLKGRENHFFEFGIIGGVYTDGYSGAFLRLGYRYQGPRGFLFRSAPLLGFSDGHFIPLPALSLGYSF